MADLFLTTKYSQGYIGRDTGVLHMAAALNKPVFSIYGSGHRPRFTPSTPHYSIPTNLMPCRDCDWICPFEKSRCIKDIALEPAVRAFDKFAQAAFRGQTTIEFQADETQFSQLLIEAAHAFHDHHFAFEKTLATFKYDRLNLEQSSRHYPVPIAEKTLDDVTRKALQNGSPAGKISYQQLRSEQSCF
jgi:hypothetical protein